MPETDTSLGENGPASVGALRERLAEARYFADDDLATTLFLGLRLGKPLLLEGDAGVGKTEVAKALAAVLGGPLIRLQCYEGLDVHSAVYEWDYSRQLLHIRLTEAGGQGRADLAESSLFRPEFLLRRPLLQAVEAAALDRPPPVLLIDELDRADEEFEAYLLELLSDFQITIPELGTIRAARPPVVVITSNRTREVHDALRRRCLYRWIDYPDADKEHAILRARVPEVDETLSRKVVDFVQRLRDQDLYKRPGIAETLDWALALHALDVTELTPDVLGRTLGALLKYQDDVDLLQGDRLAGLLEQR